MIDDEKTELLHFRKMCPICDKITTNDMYYIDVDLPSPGNLYDNKRILVCRDCGLMRMLP